MSRTTGVEFRIERRDYAPLQEQAAHVHEVSSIALVVRGEVFESAGSTKSRAGAGDVVVKPAHVLHSNRYGTEGATLYSIAIADHPVPYRWAFGRSSTSLFAAAVIEWRDGRNYQDIVCDLVAAVGAADTPQRSHMKRRMAREAAESSAPVSEIARSFSIHPVVLARAFRHEYGCSITSYRRRARVRRAAELLAATKMPLVDIALETGFSDQSHLCRLFRMETGLSPSRFRSLAVSTVQDDPALETRSSRA